jgi:hypothetical protein
MHNQKILHHFGDKPLVWAPLWGISKLRKRGGGFAGSINGMASWYDEWYDRVMSRGSAEKLAELGINLVVLPFSIGGSHGAEKAERDDFQRMAKIYHELGVKVLPYLQYQNFLQEEHPAPEADYAVAADGGRIGYSYWRRTVCQSSAAFREYFRELITDSIERGADGIWIDNNYLRPCYCARCKESFREFLTGEYSFLLAELYLADFSKAEIPPQLENTRDPLVQAYLEFNCQRNLEIHRELKTHMESLSPQALFGSNPALYRGNSYAHRGIDFKALIELNDLMYLENKLFPEKKGGQTSGNFHGFVTCEALGAIGIPGAWKKEDFDHGESRALGMPETDSEIARVLFEATCCGGSPGVFWAVRTRPRGTCSCPEELKQMYCETPEIFASLKKNISDLRNLPVFGERRNAANVAILQHRESTMLDFDVHNPAVHAVEEILHVSGIPYQAAFSEELEKACEKYALIILPHVSILKDREVTTLGNFVKNGGRLLAIGDCGLYDERFRERLNFALGDILGIDAFSKYTRSISHTFGEGKTVYFPASGDRTEFVNLMSAPSSYKRPSWAVKAEEIASAARKLLADDLQVLVDPAIPTALSQLADGRKSLQLISYEADSSAMRVTISVVKNSCGMVAELHHPGEKTVLISGQEKAGRIVFCFENFRRYVCMVF